MEQAFMVAVYEKGEDKARVSARLVELQGLIEATGTVVVGSVTQARDTPRMGLGRGALAQLQVDVDVLGASMVVFDQEITPSQQLATQQEMRPGVQVLDRTQIILDIFARRAASREGQLQVELAQYRYLEPRLRGIRIASRPSAGVGTRGPGETFLELDRRRVRRRIHELSNELASVERIRQERRQRRRRTELPLVTLVGYTNVGKSTLYARLTRRPQPVRDALFVTLDSTVRRILLPEFGPVLLTDTVGFVSHLPHHLVAAFRSTLDEVRDADLICEVINGDPNAYISVQDQVAVIEETSKALGTQNTPKIRIYNQWDRVPAASSQPTDGIPVSGLTGQGLDELVHVIAEKLAMTRQERRVQVPWENRDAWKILYRDFVILEREDFSDFANLWVRGSEQAFHLLLTEISP